MSGSGLQVYYPIKAEIQRWLNEDQLVETFLKKTPPLLERRMDFEQMSLFTLENSK